MGAATSAPVAPAALALAVETDWLTHLKKAFRLSGVTSAISSTFSVMAFSVTVLTPSPTPNAMIVPGFFVLRAFNAFNSDCQLSVG